MEKFQTPYTPTPPSSTLNCSVLESTSYCTVPSAIWNFSYFATYFTSLWASEVKAKYLKRVYHYVITGLSLALIPYSTFLTEKLCIKTYINP